MQRPQQHSLSLLQRGVKYIQTLPIPIHNLSCTNKVPCFYLDSSCLMYLSVRRRQQSTLSSDFQITPNCQGPAGVLECRAAIQRGWRSGVTCWMKFNKDKCEVPHIGRNSPLQQSRPGRACWEGCGSLGREQAKHGPTLSPGSKRGQHHPGLY